MSTDTTYVPSDRVWEQKTWLYEQYWANLHTIQEIADTADVSHQTILRQMEVHGIPRRSAHVSVDSHKAVAQHSLSEQKDEPSSVSWNRLAAE